MHKVTDAGPKLVQEMPNIFHNDGKGTLQKMTKQQHHLSPASSVKTSPRVVDLLCRLLTMATKQYKATYFDPGVSIYLVCRCDIAKRQPTPQCPTHRKPNQPAGSLRGEHGQLHRPAHLFVCGHRVGGGGLQRRSGRKERRGFVGEGGWLEVVCLVLVFSLCFSVVYFQGRLHPRALPC